MPRFSTENIRNVAIVGHAGSGKTTLIESLLYHSGAINVPGNIECGTTLSDYTPQEKSLQHSIDVSLCSFDHDNHHVNLLDTPGYPELMGRTLSILPAADSVAIVVNAHTGIEQVTQLMVEKSKEAERPCMIIVNKTDGPAVQCADLLTEMQERFGAECLPLNLPAADGQSVVDCFFQHGDAATAFSDVQEVHNTIVDQVVEMDEALMQLYLEQGEELSPEQLHEPFEQALREGHLIPVCFVSAQSGAGVPQLLEVLTQLMPNPLETNPPQFLKGEGPDAEPVRVEPDPDAHVVAHVFKVAVDPYMGRIGLFRIYQGTVKTGSQLFIGDSRKPFKVTHLIKLQGKEHTEISAATPGDLCAIAKIDELEFDAVLHDNHDEDDYHLRMVERPLPMCGLAIRPTRRGDEQKLSDALHKLASEDPGILIEHRASQNETVLYGSGELHLKIILDRMQDQYNLQVDTHPPSIAYRETITTPAEGHCRHKKQTGGAGQFGEVFLRITPLERGAGFRFVNKVVGGAIPSQFIPAVEKGIHQVLESGALAGFPLQDIEVTVYDGKHHSVDSKEIAFVAAGKKAFLDAIEHAHPILLEPIVDVSIITPSDNVGDITGDISSKRGMINGTAVRPQQEVEISAQLPLAEMDGYQSRLKALTGGEGQFSMVFSHYAPLPQRQQDELVASHQPAHDS
ncbi:elongation factor G [Pontibacterium granulatum]|uniref:elongation factor G n=1 Tax=Pontibacterium granulatum TaxID=2036029 RepID=UPI00249A8F3E|nr:elongation factor G [Pontibacterium granulatum]MDI3326000.1 elongation factor G [Pontibacterium granulatum]